MYPDLSRFVSLLKRLVLFVPLLLPAFGVSQKPTSTGEERHAPSGPKKKEENRTPVAAPKACCSCAKSLRLVLQHNGPIETPPETKWVDDSEDPTGEKVKVSTGTRKQPGHVFQVIVGFETMKSDQQGDLTLHWFERADSVPSMINRAGIPPNTWYDAQQILTTSQVKVRKADGKEPQAGDKDSALEPIAEYVKRHHGTAMDWVDQYLNRKSKICPQTSSVYIDDKPAASKPRKLEFHIVIENPVHCGCAGPAKLELWATQLLVAKTGATAADQTLSGFYGPNGKMKPDQSIEGQPIAPQPKVP